MAIKAAAATKAGETGEAIDNLASLGATGLRQYGGWIDEEFLPRLKGRRGVELYREMSDNDAIVGAVLYVIGTLVRQVEWTVEPADESEAAKAEAAFVESCIADTSHTFEAFLDEALSMLVYGWSYFEIVYKLRRGEAQEGGGAGSAHDDGRIGWRKIEIRGQDTLDRWEIDEHGSLRGLWQAADTTTGLYAPAFVPIEKSLLFRPKRHKGNPEGRSILRNAVRSWSFAKRMQEIEAIGVERDLAGLPVFEVPPEILAAGATPAQQQIRSLLERLVQQIRRDEREGLLIPASERTGPDGTVIKTGYKFSLLSSSGKRALDTNAIITRYEQRIAMSVLGEFVMLGMQNVGSRSLASSKTDMFTLALGALLGEIASTFNRYAIARLMRLNRVAPELWPSLAYGDIETPPLEEIGAYITSLANAGFAMTNNAALERQLLSYAGLPEPTDEDVVETPAPAGAEEEG